MAFDPEVVRAASAALQKRTLAREARERARREEIYAAVPALREIDGELKKSVPAALRRAMADGGDAEEAMRDIRSRNLALQAKRQDLLARAGYAPDAMDEHPNCTLCGDTGWRGTEMCTCLRELCLAEQNRRLSSLLDLGNRSFDTFDLDLYSTDPDPGTGISPRQNMELIYELCLSYATKFGRFGIRNLLLTGGTGLGKTYLSACIAREVSEQGHSVVYDTAVHVFQTFDDEKFARDPDAKQEAKEALRRYLECDLVILDDLGSETTTQPVQSYLYTLVNTRLIRNLATVISTNLGPADLQERYAPQTVSRLEGEYQSLHFYGQDIRILKKAES